MLNEAREITERWLAESNSERLHKSLNNLTTEEHQLMAQTRKPQKVHGVKTRVLTAPPSREEFVRLINACANQQIENTCSLAVYTGARHGELVSHASEDIDLNAGTMMIRRNHTVRKVSTLPKTEADTDRIIELIQSAIEVLRSHAEVTRFGK